MSIGVEASRDADLGRRTIAGAALFLGANLGERVLNLVSMLALARLLTPEDFGVVALAFFVIELSHVFSNLQFGNAIVRMREVEEDHYDTAFTLSAIRGALLAGAVILAAEPLANFFGTPELAVALMIAALAPLLEGLRNPRIVRFARAVKFGPEVQMDLSARFVLTLFAILVAAIWGSYLAMIVGSVAAAATRLTLSYALAPGRPRITLRLWRPLFAFGGWLTAAGATNFLSRRLDVAVIGALFGVRATGVFSIADRATGLVTQELMVPLLRVIFPALSAIGHDRARMLAAYYKAQGVILALVLPAGVGLALIAPEAVHLIAGDQWGDAAPLVQILAPVMALGMTTAGANAILMVDGDTRAIFLRNALVLAIKLPVLAIGALTGGFLGVIVARAAGLLVDLVATLQLVSARTESGFAAPFVRSWRSFAACAAMAAAVTALGPWTPEWGGAASAMESAATKTALGALVYMTAHLLLWLAAGRPDGVEAAVLKTAQRGASRLRRGSDGADRP